MAVESQLKLATGEPFDRLLKLRQAHRDSGAHSVLAEIHGISQRDLMERPLLVCGAQNRLAQGLIAAANAHTTVLAAIDDGLSGTTVSGVSVIDSNALRRLASEQPNFIAVNATFSKAASTHFRTLLGTIGHELHDFEVVRELLHLAVGEDYFGRLIERTLQDFEALGNLTHHLGDELSRRTLEACLLYRLTLDRGALTELEPTYRTQYFQHGLFDIAPDEIFVDGGAYCGDTTERFLALAGNSFGWIHAFEPDPNNFKKLRAAVDGIDRITCHASGLWDGTATLTFDAADNEMSRIDQTGDIHIPVAALDDIVDDATLIKLDVEGSEVQALNGAAGQITKNKPKLAVSLYHEPQHLLALPTLVRAMRADYKLYIRHHGPSLFDTVMYAL